MLSKLRRNAGRARGVHPSKQALLQLRKLLSDRVDAVARAVRAQILPSLGDLYERLDGPAEVSRELQRKLAALRVKMFETVPVEQIKKIGARADKDNAEEVTRVIGIPVKSDPKTATMLDRFRADNVDLIRSLSSDALDEISGLVDQAHTNGVRVETLQKQIEARIGVSRSRAELIARDQIGKLNGQLNQVRQTNAGISKYRWSTSRDERVRGNPDGKYPPTAKSSDHWHLDGQVFSWDEPPIVNESTGARAHPGIDIQCRCIAIPVLDALEDLENVDEPDDSADAVPEQEPEQIQEPEPIATEPEPGPTAQELLDLIAPEPPRAEPLAVRARDTLSSLGKGLTGQTLEAQAATRNGLRSVLREAYPGIQSRDVGPLAGTFKINPAELRAYPQEVSAFHDWSGYIAVRPNAARYTKDVFAALAEKGPLLEPTVQERHSLVQATVTLHEELHGHSRITPDSYSGLGRITEEVGTEISARKAVQQLAPGMPWDAPEHNAYGDGVRDAMRHTSEVLGITQDQAAEAWAHAHTSVVCGPGKPFATPDEASDTLIHALTTDPAHREELKRRLGAIPL